MSLHPTQLLYLHLFLVPFLPLDALRIARLVLTELRSLLTLRGLLRHSLTVALFAVIVSRFT